MPTDTQKLMQNKESIISKIQSRGPSLPVQIARETAISPLFASAYLSELYNENKLKMSHMKVGSSPLYYISGQEGLLENFVQYLNNKEKEAFNLLKTQKLLEDDKMEPAIRVAVRAIKDFATPIRIKIGEDSKLFWKHFLVTDDEVKEIAQIMFGQKKEKKKKEESPDKQETLVKKESEDQVKSIDLDLEQKTDDDKEKENISQIKKNIDTISQELKNIQPKESPKKEKKVKIVPESKFVKDIKAYLLSRNIELLAVIDEKKKDLIAKIMIDTIFGKQEYLLIGKDKKKITEEDLTIALHKAQLEKMPALFIAPGDIDKKSLEHATTWKNLVKFEKLKS